ncbi:MAG: 2-oxoglutarate dehydrogenase E1 component, partial [Pseudomonadota bacterium]
MLKQLLENSHLFGGNAPYVEQLYESWLENPGAVPEEWRNYFDKLQLLPGAAAKDIAHAPVVESFAQRAKSGPAKAVSTGDLDRKQVSVIQLVAEYRFRGCLLADLDPLKRQQRPHIAELEPAYYDLGEADMDTVFNTGSFIGPEQATLREIIRGLQETYCGTLGVEYMYLSSRAEKRWIQER